MECLKKLQVLMPCLGQMRETINETMGSLLVKAIKVRGGIPTLDMTRKQCFVFYDGSNPSNIANFSQWCNGSTPSIDLGGFKL